MYKKNFKKSFIKSFVVVGIISSFVTGISAASVSFSKSVPTMQGTAFIDETAKTEITDYGRVKLTKKEPDSVSFSAKGPGLSTYGPVTQVKKTGTWYKVNYFAEYGIGTKMMAMYRNSNWSVNSNMITGTFDYK